MIILPGSVNLKEICTADVALKQNQNKEQQKERQSQTYCCNVFLFLNSTRKYGTLSLPTQIFISNKDQADTPCKGPVALRIELGKIPTAPHQVQKSSDAFQSKEGLTQQKCGLNFFCFSIMCLLLYDWFRINSFVLIYNLGDSWNNL